MLKLQKKKLLLQKSQKLKNQNQKSEETFPPVTFKKIRSKLFSVNTSAPENNDPYLLPENIRKQMNPELQNVYVMP